MKDPLKAKKKENRKYNVHKIKCTTVINCETCVGDFIFMHKEQLLHVSLKSGLSYHVPSGIHRRVAFSERKKINGYNIFTKLQIVSFHHKGLRVFLLYSFTYQYFYFPIEQGFIAISLAFFRQQTHYCEHSNSFLCTLRFLVIFGRNIGLVE